MSEATTAIKEFLRIEEQNIEEVTVPEILGQLSHHSAIDGPQDVRDALDTLRGDSEDGGNNDSDDINNQDADDTIQTLSNADDESFEECISVIEDVDLLREYVSYEAETQTRKDRIAATNKRIDRIREADNDSE